MERIAAHAVADELGENTRTASLGKFKFLKDQNPGAFPDNKTVTLGIKRPRRMFRIVIPRRKSPHRSKPRHGHRRYCAFSAAADHGVRIAAFNILKLSPIAWAPAEHAVAVAEFGPLAPYELKPVPLQD